MTREPTRPLFRWDGKYWGFVANGQVYDRYGRHVGWVEPAPKAGAASRERRPEGGRSEVSRPDEESPQERDAPAVLDVYDRRGRFMGQIRDQYYVLRDGLRPEPIHLASRPAVSYPTPPDPLPDLDERDPVEGWRDALPWPLPSPDPPTR